MPPESRRRRSAAALLALPLVAGCVGEGPATLPLSEATEITDCVLRAATTEELLEMAAAGEREAERMLRRIAARPAAAACDRLP